MRPVLEGRLGRLMAGISAFELGNVAATLLILRATDLLEPGRGQGAAAQQAIALYVGYNVAALLASLVAGQLGDRRGVVRVLAGGVGAFGLAYAGFAATDAGLVALAGCFVAAGIGIGFVETAEHAAVASMAPAEIRGSAFGLLAAVQSFGNLAASVIAGLLYTVASPAAAFGYSAALMGWRSSRCSGPAARWLHLPRHAAPWPFCLPATGTASRPLPRGSTRDDAPECG